MNYNDYGWEDKIGTRIEEVPTIVAPGYEELLAKFPKMYRAPLGGSGRWYFLPGSHEFFSGVTGAISKSPFSDHSGLNKARVNLAYQGRDADQEWGERADYGSCFHLLVSLHERGEVPFHFGDYGEGSWRQVMNDLIEAGGYQMFRTKWEADLQNDMAAYFKWKKDYDVKVITTEVMAFNRYLGIATPLDLVVEMNFNRKRIMADVNLKTGDKGFHSEYELQCAIESWMFNQQYGSDFLSGAFCLRPKSRERSPGEYEMSKNYFGVSEDDLDLLSKTVKVRKLNKPNGKVVRYTGGESNFNMEILTPEEWLTEFNQSLG